MRYLNFMKLTSSKYVLNQHVNALACAGLNTYSNILMIPMAWFLIIHGISTFDPI